MQLFGKSLLVFTVLLLLLSTTGCTYQPDSRDSIKKKGTGEQVKAPKNIILMIGDGMGLTQITAAMLVKSDALHVERCPVIGLVKTSSADNIITDSAAGATAMATGTKTKNGSIGLDVNGKPLTTIIEIAEKKGLSTGIAVTSSVTHATPAAFIAHQPDRYMQEEIAADFMKTEVDVIIGGGLKYFNSRSDGRNLVDEMRKKGYRFTASLDEINVEKDKMTACFLADGEPGKFSEGRNDMLPRAVEKSTQILGRNKKGFFLMVEGSQIDWGGHENNISYIIDEMIDFDLAIGVALDFAKENGETLVIITSDHETGGLSITGGSPAKESSFSTKDHTPVMVPLFAYGPGAELFSGIMDNTDLFFRMVKVSSLQ